MSALAGAICLRSSADATRPAVPSSSQFSELDGGRCCDVLLAGRLDNLVIMSLKNLAGHKPPSPYLEVCATMDGAEHVFAKRRE